MVGKKDICPVCNEKVGLVLCLTPSSCVSARRRHGATYSMCLEGIRESEVPTQVSCSVSLNQITDVVQPANIKTPCTSNSAHHNWNVGMSLI